MAELRCINLAELDLIATSWSERKGEVTAPTQHEQRIGAFALKCQLQPFDVEDDKWRDWARVFRSWPGRFFGGALAEVYEPVEAHWNESATINDLALTSLRLDNCLVRNIATELYHVLIMLTRGAQRVVLKAPESEALEAYRLVFQRYEPISTVTTMTSSSGDLALTYFERRVTAWSIARKKRCKIGVDIKGREKS